MAILTEGTWPCKILSATRDGNPVVVRVNVQFTEGPDKGKGGTYEQIVDARSAKYVAPSCQAIGWQGVTLDTLADDCAKWIAKTGGASTADVKHFDLKNPEAIAKAAARGEPPKFAKVNAIGRGAKPLPKATAESKADADAALRNFMGGGGGAAPSGSDDEEIPFASSAFGHDINPIAKVLR